MTHSPLEFLVVSLVTVSYPDGVAMYEYEMVPPFEVVYELGDGRLLTDGLAVYEVSYPFEVPETYVTVPPFEVVEVTSVRLEVPPFEVVSVTYETVAPLELIPVDSVMLSVPPFEVVSVM